MANLLVVSGYWPSRSDPISGIFIVEQIRALTELGHKIWVVVGMALGRHRTLLTLEELELDTDVVTMITPRFVRAPEHLSRYPVFFGLNVRNTGGFILRAIRKIRASGTELDACLVHELRYIIASAPIWQPVLNRPTLGLLHGTDPFLARNANVFYIREILKRAVDQLQAIGIVGTFLKLQVQEIGLNSDKVHLILNGTELPDTNLRFVTTKHLKSKKILSVSQLHDFKGLDDTLRALLCLSNDHGHQDWEFRVVGDGPDKPRLKQMTINLGLEEKVKFLGRLSREATLQEFGQCDLFCLPTRAEAFGIVFLEAMARSRPIIGCDNCGPADFVTSGWDGLLVPPKSPEALAEAMCMLWTNPEHLAEIGAKGRRTAENLTWTRNAKQISEILGVM